MSRDDRGRFLPGDDNPQPTAFLDWNEVTSLLKELGSAKAVAARLGCSERQVYRIRAYIDPNYESPRRGRWSPELQEKLKTALWEGWGYTQTAETYGVDATHLARKFPGFGLSPAEAGERSSLMRRFRESEFSLSKVS
jgi:AraC-like DNA-binding protein